MSCSRSTSWNNCPVTRRKLRSAARCTVDLVIQGKVLAGEAVGRGMGSPRFARSAGLGQLLFFGGLVAALWRANLAAGVSNAGIRGLAFGVAGVGILGLFEFALFLDWLGATFNPMALFAQSPVLDTGVIAGTALAFAGLASLVVGFAQSTDLFGRRERVASQREGQREETG